MTEQDLSKKLNEIDTLQERLDKTFKRVNADPLYTTEKALSDAISDNPRYFNADRKKELAEIFFSLLELIHTRISSPDASAGLLCNPQRPPENGKPRLPELEMLLRDMMPLSWALEAQWLRPELKNTFDTYLETFSPEETDTLYDTLRFIAGLFPEISASQQGRDVLEYWRLLSCEHDSMRAENNQDKAFLLSTLMAKKAALNTK